MIGQLVSEIFKFESSDRRTAAQTPDRVPYDKLIDKPTIGSGELKMQKSNAKKLMVVLIVSEVGYQIDFMNIFSFLFTIKYHIFSSPEPKAQAEFIVWDAKRLSVTPCVCASTLSNINISETSRPIVIENRQEHHWGGGLTALGLGLVWIRTLVSMATDTSHNVMMRENIMTSLAPSFFIGSSLFLQVRRTTIKSRMGSKFDKIRPGTEELAALERLEKSP